MPEFAIPCNKTQDCVGFFIAQFPNTAEFGPVECFVALANASFSLGGCACDSSFGIGGPRCLDTTQASVGSGIAVAVGLIVMFLTILKHLGTLLLVARHRVFLINAAGITYALAWLGLITALVLYSLSFVLVFTPLPNVVLGARVTQQISLVFLAACVLTMVVTFVELSSSVKLLHRGDQIRWPLISVLVLVALAILVTYFTRSTLETTALGFGVVLILAFAGLVGPVILYDATVRSMARTSGRISNVTRYEMLRAMVLDICANTNRMRMILGLTTHSNDSKISKDSKDSKDESKESKGSKGSKGSTGSKEPKESKERKAPNVLPKKTSTALLIMEKFERSSSRPVSRKGLPEVNSSRTRQMSKRDSLMISFLSRVLRMGFWLGVFLCVFLGGAAISIESQGQLDTNPIVRKFAISQMFRAIGYAMALHQILWFLDDGYRKTVMRATLKRDVHFDSKDSKDIAPSPQASKLDDALVTRVDDLALASKASAPY